MKKRKLLSIVVVGALAATMLAGCGSSSDASDSSEAADTETTETADTAEVAEDADVTEEAEVAVDAAADAAGATGGDFTLGFSTPALSMEFCANMEQAVQEACAERGYEVVVMDCGTDGSEQVSQCEDLITQGVDAIILFPFAPDACAGIGEECDAAGIPLVTVESEVPNYTAAVLTDMYEVGVAQAEKAMELVGDDIRPVILEGPTSQTTMIEVKDGAVDTFEAAGVEVLDVQVGENEVEPSQQVVENWISSGLDFNCIVSSSDESSSGAINALEDAGMLDDVVVVSDNGDSVGIDLIQQGKLECTVYLPSSNYGYQGVEVADKILNGEDYDDITYLEIGWIDDSNVDEYAEN